MAASTRVTTSSPSTGLRMGWHDGMLRGGEVVVTVVAARPGVPRRMRVRTNASRKASAGANFQKSDATTAAARPMLVVGDVITLTAAVTHPVAHLQPADTASTLTPAPAPVLIPAPVLVLAPIPGNRDATHSRGFAVVAAYGE